MNLLRQLLGLENPRALLPLGYKLRWFQRPGGKEAMRFSTTDNNSRRW